MKKMIKLFLFILSVVAVIFWLLVFYKIYKFLDYKENINKLSKQEKKIYKRIFWWTKYVFSESNKYIIFNKIYYLNWAKISWKIELKNWKTKEINNIFFNKLLKFKDKIKWIYIEKINWKKVNWKIYINLSSINEDEFLFLYDKQE